jgi:membrane fusion protein (multidrug efflux system)
MNRYEPYDAMTQDRPPRRRRLWLWIPVVVIAAAVVFGAIFAFPIAAFMATGFPTPPPTTVSTTAAKYEDWQTEISAVGSLKPVRGADLSVEVAGIIDSVNFDSGGDVAAGAVLIHLRDFDEVARLRTLEAARDLAQTNFERDRAQFQRMLISQAAFDASGANLKSAQAQVAEQEAIVAKKTLKAPFAGHLGIRNVNTGQYIAPGTAVATLQALDPIYVDFFLPQQNLDQIKVGLPVTVRVDTYPDQTFTGKITTIDPKVDAATRNVPVRATLPNASRRLLPGMFANVTITTGEPTRQITLPQTAITFNPYGNMVYLVQRKTDDTGKETMTVQQTVVQTGTTRGDQIVILSGLKEGDVVVTAGQTKLQNGAAIAVNNTIQPSNDPNPRPTER